MNSSKSHIVNIIFTLSLFFGLSHELYSYNNHFYELKDINSSNNIGKNLLILEDKNSSLSYQEALNSEGYVVSNSFVPNLGISSSTFWIKFTIKNNTNNEKLLLNLNQPTIDEVEFYSFNENGNVRIEKAGEYLPFSNRKYDAPSYIFDMDIPLNSTKTFLLKVKSKEQLLTPIYIGSYRIIFSENSTALLISSIFFGIILVMFFYNLFIFFTIKDKSYLYYVLYVAVAGLTQIAPHGYTFQYLWPNSPWIAMHSMFILPALIGIAAILFLKNFLKVKYYAPRWNIAFNVFIGIYIGLIFLSILKQYSLSFKLIQATATIVSILLLLVAFRIKKKGYRPATFFLIAWTVFLIGVVIYILKDVGLLPYNNFTVYTMQIGAAFEMVLLSFALADRINTYKKEKETAQKATLTALRKNEVLITKQNKMLEQKVTERTAELNSTNKELNSTLNNLKETQSQLVDAEKMASLGQLTAGIAHEINNPINFVSSNIIPLRQDINDLTSVLNKYEEIKEETDLKVKLKEVEELKNELDFDYLKEELYTIINGIEDGAKRTTEIVRGLKNFSRLDESDLKIVNINEGVESTLKLVTTRLKDNNIKLEKVLGNIPNAECFPGKLNQLFMNIISNSIQAIELENKTAENKQGLISIKTTNNDDFIIVSIKDNGTGMSEETKTRMFEPFFTTKDVGEGTGLGLSIVYSIIEAHKGNIKVDTKVGKGTEMIINIPIKQVAKNE